MIQYKMGVGYKEQVEYCSKKGWKLFYSYISSNSKMFKFVLEAIQESDHFNAEDLHSLLYAGVNRKVCDKSDSNNDKPKSILVKNEQGSEKIDYSMG